MFCSSWRWTTWRSRRPVPQGGNADNSADRAELHAALRVFASASPRRALLRASRVSGLIGPGDRKSVQPMAKRLALGACDQLHHFIAGGIWDGGPLETELLVKADKLVGGSDAVLVIDDTAIPK